MGHARGGKRRVTVIAVALALVSAVIVVLPVVPVSAAPPPIDVAKSGSSSVLTGSPATYTLTASNPAGGVNQYNVSFRDVLPPGVTYVPGSTTPSDVGDPTVVTGPGTGAQTLIWQDTFDLPPGATNSIGFQVRADPTVWPVQSTFTDTATGYSSTQPRVVPQFNADGTPVADPAVTASLPSSASTLVTALRVTKAEPSPEGKLLRGVHDHTTVYTLTVSGGDSAATTGVTVIDYLPASLEFLGCGGVDNSTTGVEYPGAPPLTATPPVTDCPTPVSVDTVSNPAGQPPGVYTQVVWNLGTVDAGQTRMIRYAAGIPLRQNTLDWPGGEPSPASLEQAANLDNNTGPTTRQNGTAVGLTNHVNVTGTYTGAVSPGSSTAVSVNQSHTVTANDLRVIKSVSPADFEAGQLSTYTLRIASSEYVDNSAIMVTDTIPNGVCPLSRTQNYVTGSPSDCAPGTVDPSVPYRSVTQNDDGTFTVVFDPIDLAHNGTTTITYQARMRTSYTGGDLAGSPTAAGDTFTNKATEVGTSSPIPDTGESGDATVTDSSSVTQTSVGGTSAKLIQPRAVPQDCAANTYVPAPSPPPVFQKGDRICFEIDVAFPRFNDTLNPVIADFLPIPTDYEAGSMTLGPANTVPADQISFDATSAASGVLEWTLGAKQPDGDLAVDPGLVFQARFSVIVSDAAPGTSLLGLNNITKGRWESSDGTIHTGRGRVPFAIDPAPPVSITKGVQSVNGAPAGGNPPNVDHVQVQEGDQVVFRVDVSNAATAATSVHTVKTWDVLPAGITCAAVSAITGGGVCTNPGNPAQPTFAQRATLSAIVWNRPASEVIAPGASVTYTYTVTIPTGQSVDTDLVDTASVRSFDADTNVPGAVTYFPKSNVDTTVPVADQDAPAASDNSDVFLAPVTVTKTVLSAINEAGNVGGETPPGGPSTQATIGELVTYTVTTTVPAHATVYKGVLSDPMPTGLTFVSATASGLPPGATLNTGNGTVTLPLVFDNTSATPIVFSVTITARVSTATSNKAGVTRTNTATFTSNATNGGAAVTPRTATSNVNIVEPSPAIAKAATPTQVAGGQTVTYTLTASNAASAAVLHDAWVLDCVPAGLTFNGYGTPTQGTTVAATPGTGAPQCAVGTTQLAWNVGDIAPGAAPKLTYTATVNSAATGLEKFANTATITGDALAGTRTGPTDPGNPLGRLYTKSTSRTITVLGADLVKSADPTRATIGQTVTFTLTGTLKPNVTYDNASGIDTLPAGLDPASVAVRSISCVTPAGLACLPNSAAPLTPVPLADGSVRIGLYFGDIGNLPVTRLITVVYSVRVADVDAAKAGVALTNSAHIAWNNTDKGPPVDANAPFDQVSSTAKSTVTVIEPSMSITKSVDDNTVEPGQTFHYTLHAINANTANTSDAYNVTVTDTIPAGVVVDPTSITADGVLTGTDANGAGGTISWTTPGPVTPGGTVPLEYAAKLGLSGTLTTAPQVNTAQVTGYDSLPTGGRHYPPSTVAHAPVTPLFPSVQATKSTPLGSTAFVGESFTWQIRLTNTGGGTAYNVGASDVLPPNWTYDNNSAQVSVNGGAAQQLDPSVTGSPTQTLVWTGLGNLAPNTSLTITYTATPTPGVAGSPGVGLTVNHTNTVTPVAFDATGASGNKTAPYAGPNATANAHIASADLEVSKRPGVQPIAGGRGGSWIVTVTNHGPDTASGLFVVDAFNDPLPAGVSNVVATGTGWSCSGVPVKCVRTNGGETLASGASFPSITVTYDVASDVDDGTVLTNAATVSAHTWDPNRDNNTDDASTTVATQADLGISKRLTTPLVAGDPASYTVAVTNHGPSVSAGPFTVTDTLPPGSTFVSASNPGWACDPIPPGTVGARLTCTHTASLPVGAVTDEITVTVGIPSSQTAKVVNTATITDRVTPDPNPDNDTATVTTPPTISADLKIQKEHVGTFVAGDDAQYTLTVHNNGPSDAADATITDTLPDGVTFLPSGGNGWTCRAAGQDVTCTHAAPIVDAATSTLTLNVHLAPDVDTPIENTAHVSSTTDDPVPGNNTDGDNTDINFSADLAITKQHTAEAVAGQSLTYTLGVTNNGPSRASGPVTVTDVLPDGLSFDSASGTDWDCAAAGQRVTCTRALDVAAHTDAPDITLNVTIAPDVVGTLVNPAVMNSATDDPDLTNNHTEDPTDFHVHADLSLTKSLDTPTPVLAGTEVTFTLQASNAGPSDATDVAVTDPLPDHLRYVSASGDGWTCPAPVGNAVVCSRATLPAVPPGAAVAPITVKARVDPATPIDPPDGTTILVNTATVDMSSPGTVTNPDPVPVPVVARADLTLTKEPSTDTPAAGTSLRWTMIAHNTGPSDAAGPLTLTDELPAYQSYLSAAAPWTCTAGPPPATSTDRQTVTCTLASGLPVGADAPPLTMLVQLSADAPSGTVSNTAEVSSPTPGEPGTGTGTISVSRTAKLAITKTHTGHGVVGQPIDFHLAVRNLGPSTADQLVVTDPLPGGLSYLSATGTGWTCTAAHNEMTCRLAGSLAVGADAAPITLTVRVGAAASPSATNVATVFSTDPDLTDRASASDNLAVDPDAELTLTKHHQGTFTAGEQGAYLLTVHNPGPTATPGPIRITDSLPSGLSYVSAVGVGWTCAASGRTVTCTRAGVLAVGASSSVTVTVLVQAGAAPSVTNTATVTAPGTPAVSASDVAPVTVPVAPAGNGNLAATGFDSAGWLLAALALLALGALALATGRPRRRLR